MKTSDGNIHKNHRERMRQRFLDFGLNSFHDHEALELLLYYALPRVDTNPIAHELINTFGSLAAVLDAHPKELEKVKNISTNTAVLLTMLPELFRKYQVCKDKLEKYSSVQQVGEFFVNYFLGYTQEVAVLLMLDTSSRNLGIVDVCSGGSISSVHLDYRKLSAEVLRYNASTVILAHNHPGGKAVPSRPDIQETRALRDFLRMIRVKLEDHIIVAGTEWVSLKYGNKGMGTGSGLFL